MLDGKDPDISASKLQGLHLLVGLLVGETCHGEGWSGQQDAVRHASLRLHDFYESCKDVLARNQLKIYISPYTLKASTKTYVLLRLL